MTTSSSVWFDGPVAEAVSQVNAKGCVFVVFAHGMLSPVSQMSDRRPVLACSNLKRTR